MKQTHVIESFCLSEIKKGYLLQYGSTDWTSILDNDFSIQHLYGFIEFKRRGELVFKEIPVYRLSQESVISIIKSELPEWGIIRFDFATNTGRIMEFYADECYISFSRMEEFELYLGKLAISSMNSMVYVESKGNSKENFTIEKSCPF